MARINRDPNLYLQDLTIADNPFKNPEKRLFTPNFNQVIASLEPKPIKRGLQLLSISNGNNNQAIPTNWLTNNSVLVNWSPEKQVLTLYPQTTKGNPNQCLIAARLSPNGRQIFCNLARFPGTEFVGLRLTEPDVPLILLARLPKHRQTVQSYQATVVIQHPFKT